MPKVRANDIQLYYEQFGSGPQTLVLCHGWTGSRHNWQAVIDSLPLEFFRVYAFDLRGAGRSDRPTAGYTAAQLADDLAAATLEAGVERFSFAGHSLGGVVGLNLALRHPHRLGRLILVAPAPSEGSAVVDPDDSFLQAMGPAIESGETHWAFLRDAMSGRSVREDIARRHVETYEPVCREHLVQCWDATKGDFSSRLPEITVPTLMVAGDRDFLRNANLADAQRIPNCALQVFYRVGHLVPFEVPEALAAVISDFVENGSQPEAPAIAPSEFAPVGH